MHWFLFIYIKNSNILLLIINRLVKIISLNFMLYFNLHFSKYKNTYIKVIESNVNVSLRILMWVTLKKISQHLEEDSKAALSWKRNNKNIGWWNKKYK